MFSNNCALLGLWAALWWLGGPSLFFAYVISVSLAGAAAFFFGYFLPLFVATATGAYLFYAQHNFDGLHIQPREQWAYDRAALHSSSYMPTGPVMRWLTGNIGYHHVHHLSARIPSYCLVACHEEFAHLFVDVRRITLMQIPAALRCMLWDAPGARIVSVAQAGT